MSAPLTSRRGPTAGTIRLPNSTDEAEYDRLRALARSAHAKRNSCFERSRAAYASGQRALAKELSVEGKEHDRIGDDYHRQAKDYIFRVHNAGRAGDEIDLHGLYVLEAKEILGKRIRAEQGRGGRGLHVIVGKGNHSNGGVQKIKPAVEELCRDLHLQFSTEQNAGRMYISLVPLDGGLQQQAGEVPTGNHPYPPYPQEGYDAYAGQSQQPQHVFSGASGAALHGLQGSSGSGQQQQQQGHHPDLASEVVCVAKKAFFKNFAACCVVM